MIKKTNAVVSDQSAMCIYSHYALVAAMCAVLHPRWLDPSTRLAIGKFTNIRHLSAVFLQNLLLDGVQFICHFKQFNVLFLLFHCKGRRGLFVRRLNVSQDSPVQTLQNVLGPLFLAMDIKQVVHLLGRH